MKNVQLIGGFNFVRTSLREIIKSADKEMQISAESNDVIDAVENLKNHKADIIILDISLPQKNGLETFADIKHISSNIPILVINGSEQADFTASFIRYGCNGYISNQCKNEQIVEGIYTVIRGQKYVQPPHLYEKTERILNDIKAHDGLSKRELQVFLKLAKGKSIVTVANELNISNSTVSVFRSKILKKMHLKNNAELIIYAINHHCLPQSCSINQPSLLNHEQVKCV